MHETSTAPPALRRMSEGPSQDGTHHRRTDLFASRAGHRDRLLELAVAAVLILLNGVFALSELAIVSARKARLKTMVDRARPGARAALALAEEPGRFLSTVQIGITLVGILAGAFSGAALSERFDTVLEGWGMPTPVAEPLAYALVISAITYLSVVVGELVPKHLALRAGRRDRLLELAVAAVLILLNGVFALFKLAVVSARKARKPEA